MVRMLGTLPRFARTLPEITVKEEQKVALVADFSAEETYIVNLLTQQQQRAFGTPRAVYCNNAFNPNAVVITCERTLFSTVFPAFGVGCIPLDALDTDVIAFYSQGGATATTDIAIYNYNPGIGVWFATDPLSPGFDVQAVLPEAASFQVLNESVAAGTAEFVFPASASAGYKWAKNMGNEVVWWRLGAVAAADVVTSFQMNPGEGFNGNDCQLPFRTADQISFFNPSAGDILIQAMDWLVN